MNAIERNWAILPPDLLRTIARKLIDIFDFVRFRAVCKTWHSLTTVADLSPQFPWILSRSHGPDLHFYSIAFDNGLVLGVFKVGIMWSSRDLVSNCMFLSQVINLSTRETVFVVPPPWNVSALPSDNIRSIWHHPTLIESSGEILHVTYAYEFKKFVIHRLEVGNGKENPCWVIVTNIGDRMLFIDFHQNYGDFSLKATDFCGFNFKGNCIYFIRQDKLRKNYDHYGPIYAVERYDIESATTERIHDQEGYFTWYLPALHHI
ncbi:hypothetical protein LUZ61_015988 [Rhynchospora tenuis]|uniref:F-box domain-containing protein n=1 Tax=Rhynchospora tenuis TaxID=198213 RepID=A0AAD6EJL4_9POAL|nr:hypothetical protein LUZ61_015988 [Rhynchospora tenuis]